MTTVLAVDIGGTKTILQLVRQEQADASAVIECIAEVQFESHAYATFEQVLSSFLQSANHTGLIDAACIGVAGPVKGDFAEVTNLPWRLDAASIATSFHISNVSLLNDFQAVGFGIESLGDEELYVVQSGMPVEGGVRAIIGAGTGLGIGFMVNTNNRYEVYPSEGGHAGFAPSSGTEIELLQFLQKEYAQVSYERVLSGPGLENIYRFFISGCSSQERDSENGHAMSAADITKMAAEGSNPNAQKALQLFLSIYGAQVGNVALTYMASGGVYIAGGVAPRIKQQFLQGEFLQAFAQKSKMQSLMSDFSIMIVDNPKVGLLGARNVALHLAR